MQYLLYLSELGQGDVVYVSNAIERLSWPERYIAHTSSSAFKLPES